MGFAVIWLYPMSKRPIGDEWQKGERKSYKLLNNTFKESYNVGVRLGTASQLDDDSYLCVLDCDVKSSEPHYLKEMELALKNFAPSVEFAPRVLSGRGGGSCHIYYRTAQPQQSFKALRSNHKAKVFMPSTPPTDADKESGLSEEELANGFRMRLAWEIDVYGEGKQVVMPPSIHPDTYRAYEWDCDFSTIDQIPLVNNFKLQDKKALTQPKAQASAEIDTAYKLSDCYTFDRAMYKLLVYGEGFNVKYKSRSEAVMGALNALVRAGLTDREVNAVMTDVENFISEKPLEAGKGNRDAAAKWLSKQTAKVRYEMSSARDFDGLEADDAEVLLSQAEALAQEDDLIPWVSKLKGKEGAYKPTSYNIALILRHGFNGQRLFGYNEFTQSILYMSQPPWGEKSDISRELIDSDDTQVKIWLSRFYGIETSTHAISEITAVLANENRFHPVRSFLDTLVWDGTPRLDTWLETYCHAEGDTDYLAAVGRKVLVAAVARIYQPAIKFDHMMILEGSQGIGKSSVVRILASKPWFSDSLGDITSRDVIEITRGKWIIEVGELASMSRASANEMKDFITKDSDTARKAFGRRSITVPRQYIFIGTTNDEEYLKDPTGGRRFWPVRINQVQFKELENDRDQLLAEAKFMWTMKEPLYLEDEGVRDTAKEEQSDRAVVDEIQSNILNILQELDMKGEIDFEIFFDKFCFKYGMKLTDYYLQLRCKKIFTKLGYKRIRRRIKENQHERGEGVRKYMWVKGSGTAALYKSYNGVNFKFKDEEPLTLEEEG